MWRFVSIVGSGGIGKTTVAISIAHLLLDEFDGAVFFLDLATLTDTKLVAPTVARALGFMVQAHDPLRSLPKFIGDQKILIVLDNCEHLIDAAAMLAERIVGETPQAHVLTTSREALRVEGEHVHLLYALECPPDSSNPTAAEALTYPAVQLFMERATASGHAPALSDVAADWTVSPLPLNLPRAEPASWGFVELRNCSIIVFTQFGRVVGRRCLGIRR
jgi:predicted ATPase